MKFLILTVLIINLAAMAKSGPTSNLSRFSSSLYNVIAKDKIQENVIFSPASIRSCLALAYLGADGQTAQELKDGLQLAGDSKEQVLHEFGKLLEKRKNDAAKLKIANRVYLDKRFEISSEFNEIASKSFDSAVENVKFADSSLAAGTINTWVQQQTENKITDLVDSNSFDESTAAVLVNAIYFKANWTNYFEPTATQMSEFSLSSSKKASVQMMFQKDSFRYGELTNLDATGIELPYEKTDITMLVLLPKTVDGLGALEAKLKDLDITKLSESFEEEKVRLQLPKFKIEFDISLQSALKNLNMKTMFTDSADFSNLLAKKQKLAISEVKHKAFIEVNEVGTEAAAATFAKVYLTSLILNEVVYDFVADHPFFFAIKDKENVYFAGHVAKF